MEYVIAISISNGNGNWTGFHALPNEYVTINKAKADLKVYIAEQYREPNYASIYLNEYDVQINELMEDGYAPHARLCIGKLKDFVAWDYHHAPCYDPDITLEYRGLTETIRLVEEMPCDHVFYTENGQELCHATGYEVLMDDGIWWNEYEDSEGNLYYGN